MEEREKLTMPLMSEEEFSEHIKERKKQYIENIKNGVLYLGTYNAVNKVRSIRRAMRRGRISIDGQIYPKRPFNNRANTSERPGVHSRVMNETRKDIYGQFKGRFN